MSNADFADQIMLPELLRAGLIDEDFEADEAWVDALAAIVRPRTKMPADAAVVATPVFKTAETLEYDEKSVAKGLAKEGMGTVPVSYTHLDVYKRQRGDRTTGKHIDELALAHRALGGFERPALLGEAHPPCGNGRDGRRLICI